MQRNANTVEKISTPDLGGRWLCLAVSYAVIIAYGSVLPFEFELNPAFFQTLSLELSTVIQDKSLYWDARDTPLNILLYVPLGGLLMLSMRRVLPVVAFLGVLLAATALSFGVESLQSLIPSRISSASDIVFNVCGACLGAYFAFMVSGLQFYSSFSKASQLISPHLQDRRLPQLFAPYSGCCRNSVLRFLLIGYILFLVSLLVLPFRLELGYSAVSAEFARLFELPFLSLQRDSYSKVLAQSVSKLMLFLPLGILVRIEQKKMFSGRLLLMVAIAVGFEAAQCFISSHYASSGDVCLYLSGITLGWIFADILLQSLMANGGIMPVADLAGQRGGGDTPAQIRIPAGIPAQIQAESLARETVSSIQPERRLANR